jgi:hypothetical protein
MCGLAQVLARPREAYFFESQSFRQPPFRWASMQWHMHAPGFAVRNKPGTFATRGIELIKASRLTTASFPERDGRGRKWAECSCMQRCWDVSEKKPLVLEVRKKCYPSPGTHKTSAIDFGRGKKARSHFNF